MTREEAIEILQGAIKKPNTKDGYLGQAIDMAIKVLEQEPILDKIRAEIEQQRKEVCKKHSKNEGLTNYYFGLNDGFKDARDIIDKYKAESEDKE